MDFFGILFDMKNGKKIPYSKNYFDTLFAENLAGVTTLTGTLPLTFTTSETALRSWTIYGNNTPHIASSTAVLPLTFTTKGGNAVDYTIYGNDDNGTENEYDYTAAQMLNCYVSAKGIVTYSSNDRGVIVPVQPSTTYTLVMTRCTKEEAVVDDAAAIATTTLPEQGAQGRVLFYAIHGDVSQTFTTSADEHFVYFKFCNTTKSYLDEQLQSIMLVKGSTAPDHYIPYQQGVGEQRVDGYYVPLTISQQGQPDKTVDIYIGDSPLTEGETVSKTSTGVDIELFEGENTVSTTLYNKPETSITYTDYLGVGEYVNGQWQIPLTVSDGTNTATVNIPIDAPLTEGQSVTDTQTINTFEGENTIDTMLTNKSQMTITYKGG